MTLVTTPRKALVALAFAETAGLMLTSCSTAAPERDAETNEVTSVGSESAFSMNIGDCFNDEGESDEVSDLPVVPCDQPHDNEVVYITNLGEGDFPGDEVLGEQATQICVDQFESIVGVAYD